MNQVDHIIRLCAKYPDTGENKSIVHRFWVIVLAVFAFLLMTFSGDSWEHE